MNRLDNESKSSLKNNSMEAYLFVHFYHGEDTPEKEQIYFAVSKDGMKWDGLNNEKPVLISELGEKGVRDPYIIRSKENDKFYLIATDLSIYNNNDWTRAQTSGSKSIMVWESSDLVNWSKQRMVKVARDDAGCTWAPEVAYDKNSGEYMVFWASKVESDNYLKQRIYSSRTKDFINFTEPEMYIEKANHIIDTTIIEQDGKYYRFSKDETSSSIIMEVSYTLNGDFELIDNFTMMNVKGYEGPICYKLNGQEKWCLLLDAFATGQGYQAFVTDDLGSGNFTEASSEFITPYKFRHGTVMPITIEEYNKLKEAFGNL
jgi:sucrose-6-phosphate hydrolase SacC (GH32 family)